LFPFRFDLALWIYSKRNRLSSIVCGQIHFNTKKAHTLLQFYNVYEPLNNPLSGHLFIANQSGVNRIMSIDIIFKASIRLPIVAQFRQSF